MHTLKQIAFWLATVIVMATLYMSSMGGFLNAFVLSVLLLPGAILLAFFIDQYRAESGWKKWLHIGYSLLISLYAEWLGLIVAYWFLFELNLSRIPKLMVNPIFLWMWMLFFVFVRDRLFAKKKQNEPHGVEFEILSERKKMNINLQDVLFIESKDEVCTIHMNDQLIKTRERISKLEERLPEAFLRTHRSFIVNSRAVAGKSKNALMVRDVEIPISRKYKDKVESIFPHQ